MYDILGRIFRSVVEKAYPTLQDVVEKAYPTLQDVVEKAYPTLQDEPECILFSTEVTEDFGRSGERDSRNGIVHDAHQSGSSGSIDGGTSSTKRKQRCCRWFPIILHFF